MKKFFGVCVIVMLAFVAKAAGELNYVIVEGKTFFSEEVKVGVRNIRMTTDEGLTMKAPLKKVNAYYVDGKVCDRLPLMCCNGKVKCTALLELVSHRNGLRLYKYHTEDARLGCCFQDQANHGMVLLVYKRGKLHLRVDKENMETVLAFFRVPYKGNI